MGCQTRRAGHLLIAEPGRAQLRVQTTADCDQGLKEAAASVKAQRPLATSRFLSVILEQGEVGRVAKNSVPPVTRGFGQHAEIGKRAHQPVRRWV